MAARNIAENKRFVYRSSDKKPTTYVVTTNGSRSDVSSKHLQQQSMPTTKLSPPPPPQPKTPVDTNIPHVKVTPARRVVVIRNTRNPQITQQPVDLGNLEQLDSMKTPPVINEGNKSVYFIRRPIALSEPSQPVD